jgi:hypothetical protein
LVFIFPAKLTVAWKLSHAKTDGQCASKPLDFSQAGAEFVAFPKYCLSRPEHNCVSVQRKEKRSAA